MTADAGHLATLRGIGYRDFSERKVELLGEIESERDREACRRLLDVACEYGTALAPFLSRPPALFATEDGDVVELRCWLGAWVLNLEFASESVEAYAYNSTTEAYQAWKFDGNDWVDDPDGR